MLISNLVVDSWLIYLICLIVWIYEIDIPTFSFIDLKSFKIVYCQFLKYLLS